MRYFISEKGTPWCSDQWAKLDIPIIKFNDDDDGASYRYSVPVELGITETPNGHPVIPPWSRQFYRTG
jgi:hypothetical protein